MAVQSPCVKVCSIDPKTGWCIGCGRSREEIAGWSTMSDAKKALVLDNVAERPKGLTMAAIQMDCATCGACSGPGAQAA